MDGFEACRERARAEARRGRFAEAAAALGEAIAARPDDLGARLQLVTRARLLRRQRRPGEAVEALRDAAAPGGTALALGGALLDDGQLNDAAAAFREAIRAAPGDARAHVGLAAALERAGRLADASAAYREAARRRPGDPRVLVALGPAPPPRRPYAEAA